MLCCTLGRWSAEYGADGEDGFSGSGNPVVNKDYEILKLKKENEELRKEVAILKNPGLLEASPSVRFEFVRTGEHGMSVKKVCGALGVSRGRYYAFLKRPKSSRQIARGAGAVRRGHLLRQQSQIRVEADRRRASQDRHRRERQDRAAHDDEEGASVLQGPQKVQKGRKGLGQRGQCLEQGKARRRSSRCSRRRRTGGVTPSEIAAVRCVLESCAAELDEAWSLA